MTVTQLSKIILRHESSVTLPGLPATPGGPPTPGLDVGEVGYATDTGQVFIGADSSFSTATRTDFPYQNIEVLTEFSPVIASLVSRTPTTLSAVPVNRPTPTGIIIPTSIDDNNLGNGVSIFYTLIESGSHVTRRGQLRIVTDGTQGNTVLDDQNIATSSINISFSAVVSGATLAVMILNHETTPLSFVFAYRIL